MLSNIQKIIIIRAIQIRMKNGEEPEKILESYNKLTSEEKNEILAEVLNFQ